MELSDAGIEFIAFWEGKRNTLYNDPLGHCTIGIGHLVHLGPCDGSEPEEFRSGLSDDQVWELFRSDVGPYVDAVNAAIQVPLTQQQFDALVDFAFNWGIPPTTGFPATSVVAHVNRGDFEAAAADLVDGRGPSGRPYDKGLLGVRNRRIAEAELLLKARMTPTEIIRAVAADLEAAGVEVEWVNGWEGRGRPYEFEPAGLVCHHTAGPSCHPGLEPPGPPREIGVCAAADPDKDGALAPEELKAAFMAAVATEPLPIVGVGNLVTAADNLCSSGDYPSLRVVRDGRSDLPGPLAQFGLGRSGRVYVVADGYSNHAGPGGWNGLSGNGSVWGIEPENNGVGEPWFDEQLRAYKLLAAGLAYYTGFAPEMIAMHREWSIYKIDPTGIDGDEFRSAVADLLADINKEDGMAAWSDEDSANLDRLANGVQFIGELLNDIKNIWFAAVGSGSWGLGLLRMANVFRKLLGMPEVSSVRSEPPAGPAVTPTDDEKAGVEVCAPAIATAVATADARPEPYFAPKVPEPPAVGAPSPGGESSATPPAPPGPLQQ